MYGRPKKASRPPKPTPRQHIEKMIRSFGEQDESLLDAILEGVSEEELAEQGRRFSTLAVIGDAYRVYLEAYSFFRKSTSEQRSKLRGFSPQLLSLAGRQAIELDDLYAQSQQHHEAENVAKSRLMKVFDETLVLRAQARHVLEKVAGDDQELRTLLQQATTASATPSALADALQVMVRIGALLLWAEAERVRHRAALYGFDESYLETLSAAGEALQKAERDAREHENLAHSGITENDLWRANGINMMLLTHVADAFETANQVLVSVPKLHLRMTSRTVSLKPPPSRVKKPLARTKAEPQTTVIMGKGNPFAGGLGKRNA